MVFGIVEDAVIGKNNISYWRDFAAFEHHTVTREELLAWFCYWKSSDGPLRIIPSLLLQITELKGFAPFTDIEVRDFDFYEFLESKGKIK